MDLSFDSVMLLTQSKNLWCHLALLVNKTGHSGGETETAAPPCDCYTGRDTEGGRHHWAPAGRILVWRPSAMIQHLDRSKLVL